MKQRGQPFFSKPFLIPTSQYTKEKDSHKLSEQQEHTPAGTHTAKWQWQKHTSVIKEMGNKAQQHNTEKKKTSAHFVLQSGIIIT